VIKALKGHVHRYPPRNEGGCVDPGIIMDTGFTFEDYGDPAGEQRSAMTAGRDEKTCFDILRGKGIRMQAGEQNVTIRLLHKGFAGRYQFKRVKVAGAAERYHDEPDKNEYSHPHDALQYVVTRVFGGIVRGRQEGQEGLKLPPLVFAVLRK
jgi:hypothetical protein